MKSLLESSLAGLATLMLIGGAAFLPSATQAALMINEGSGLFDTTTQMPVTSFEAGDKLFSDFTCETGGAGTGGCDTIIITKIETGNFGFQGQISFAGNDGETLDVLLQYTVTRTNEKFLISDALLTFAGTVITGDAQISIGETFWADAARSVPLQCGGVDCKLQVTDPPPSFSDSFDFDTLVDTVYVTKDIFGQAAACIPPPAFGQFCFDNSFAFSVFTQRYSQVPEPATLGLFGIGLAGVGFMMRRRRKTAV